jgi:WhiB family redox-sensing transcriptional regulator
MFFSVHPDEIARAKAACAGCPARRACLRLAVERAEPCGVWGGELLQHGVPVAAPPKRGRPRRSAAA